MASALARKNPVETGGTFRILIGTHLGDGPAGCECDACLNSAGKNHRYEAFDPRRHTQPYDNDIIDSKVDLELRFNRGPMSKKFERVHEGYQSQPPAPYPLEKMTSAQLLMVAADEGIDT